MLRSVTLAVAVVASFSLGMLACSGAPEDRSPSSDQSDDALRGTLASPVGSWTNENGDPDSLVFYTIDLMQDGSFHATGGCRPNPNGPSCFALMYLHGTWSIDRSGPQLGAPGGAPELVLTDDFGQVSSYFYSVRSNKLTLRTTLIGQPSVFTKDAVTGGGNDAGTKPGPGEEGGMCGGFAGLPCAAGLVCDAPAQCCDMPGTCVKP